MRHLTQLIQVLPETGIPGPQTAMPATAHDVSLRLVVRVMMMLP
jgi:hypothetical protein